ncbi:MAG: N-acetylmuramoyl-L-alanine amidase [Pseudomonadota bacterium]
MSLRRLKPYLTVFILLSILLPSIVTASQQKIPPKTFQQTIDELQRLINRDDCSAKEMRQIAHDFLELHKREKGINRISSFYFAGKAYLNLYKLSGDARHIDKCITYLNSYKKAPQHSKHYREALFDIKEAYLLKRKNKEFTTPGKTSSKSKKGIEEASPSNSVMSSLTPTPENKPKVVDSSDQTREIAQPSYNFVFRTRDRTPMNRVGNPFFVPDEFESIVPQPLEPRIKSAAIIPPSVTDAKSGSEVPDLSPPKNSHVVVIDPGHGGKDPGAISYDRKVTEKEVALELSKLIKKNLKKLSPNIKVFLTRTDDTFLTLRERAKIANSHGADVFISVHCNGSDFKSANGPEIFYLSKSSSRGAMRAAARENGVSLSKMTDLEATLIDLLTTSKNSESTKLAQVVHNSLIATDANTGITFRDRGVKQAPFYVLIGATMPAILVECGFVNNLAQQAPDSREDFIKSVALKLASGTLEYLRKLPANPH